VANVNYRETYVSMGYVYVRGLDSYRSACLNDPTCDYTRWNGYDGMVFTLILSLGASPTGFTSANYHLYCFPNPVSTRS